MIICINMKFSCVIYISLISLFCLFTIECHHIPSETYNQHFNPYNYGYDVEDNYGNRQWRQERSLNPMEVHGSYGYRDNNGVYREVHYVADKNGFKATIKTNEPTLQGLKDPASVRIESLQSVQPNGKTI